jgi:hypothetical protein
MILRFYKFCVFYWSFILTDLSSDSSFSVLYWYPLDDGSRKPKHVVI